MSTVLRLNSDLAIVPSMVQAVDVAPHVTHRVIGGGCRVSYRDGFVVRVRYLMGEPVAVATFVTPAALNAPDFGEHVEACEARAHRVYEQIIAAVRAEEQT